MTNTHQIKVTLLETQPSIWRRFQVPDTTTLHDLHLILQSIMGWTNSHLYQFLINDNYYLEPHPDNDHYEIEAENSRTTRLSEIAQTKFNYEYDFGDSWQHEILVESVEPGESSPICLDGERACPPEDCGGIWGYDNLLEIIGDPKHQEHDFIREWAGEDFDPEGFNVDEVNRRLATDKKRQGVTPRQGQYLSYVHHFTLINRRAPTPAEIMTYFDVSLSAVNQMLSTLEERGFIYRIPYQPLNMRVLVSPQELPILE
jgi:hypothetical protein